MATNDNHRKPIQIPKGGFHTNEQDARWLANTIDLRLAEIFARILNMPAERIKVGSVNDTLYELLLMSLNEATERGRLSASKGDDHGG